MFLNNASPIVLVLALIIAVFLWGAGYKLYRLAVFFLGFIAGFTISGMITKLIPDIPIQAIIIQILCGLAVGAVSFLVLKLGLFVAAACATFLVLNNLLQSLEITGLIIAFAAAVVAGFIATKADKPVIIVLTGILGGFAIPMVLYQIFEIMPFDIPALPPQNSLILYIVKIALSLVGIIIQFAQTKEEEK